MLSVECHQLDTLHQSCVVLHLRFVRGFEIEILCGRTDNQTTRDDFPILYPCFGRYHLYNGMRFFFPLK